MPIFGRYQKLKETVQFTYKKEVLICPNNKFSLEKDEFVPVLI
jgi:hypothetical protein